MLVHRLSNCPQFQAITIPLVGLQHLSILDLSVPEVVKINGAVIRHIHLFTYVLPEPSPILTKLKNADVIIIDKMSMMTSNMLCAVEQCLKQSTRTADIHHYKTNS